MRKDDKTILNHKYLRSLDNFPNRMSIKKSSNNILLKLIFFISIFYLFFDFTARKRDLPYIFLTFTHSCTLPGTLITYKDPHLSTLPSRTHISHLISNTNTQTIFSVSSQNICSQNVVYLMRNSIFYLAVLFLVKQPVLLL